MAEVERPPPAQRSTQDEVAQFGQRMVDDHSKAGEEPNDLAT